MNKNWYNINFLKQLYKFLMENYTEFTELKLLEKQINLIENFLINYEEPENLNNFTFKNEPKIFYENLIKENLTIHPTKLTIIILTYNEERCIKRCIESCINLTNEIIILDTGSTDDTLNIINSFNSNKIKLFSVNWNSDFSEVRNIGIEKASGDWIFFIDADEYFDIKCSEPIQNIINIFNNYSNKENLVLSPSIMNHNYHINLGVNRLFFNTPKLKFFGKIHEELRNTETRIPTEVIYLNILLHHDGYKREIIDNKKKVDRNILLLKEMISIEPDNIRWKLFLARDGMLTLAESYVEEILIETIKICSDKCKDKLYKTYTEVAYKYLIELYICNNKFDKIPHLSSLLYKLDGNINNFIYYKNIYELYEIKTKLKSLILDTIKIRKKNLKFYSDLHSTGANLDFILAILLQLNGNFEKSSKFFDICKDKYFDERIIKFLVKNS